MLIGKSIVVKGEIDGSEDLTIEGQVEGKITLKQHALTIGTHGRVRAHVFARSVVILGEVIGNIEATEKVSISAEGTVEGDIKALGVAIAEGARFRGGIDRHQGQQADRTRDDLPREAGASDAGSVVSVETPASSRTSRRRRAPA